jgi:hypothetical protein
MLTLSIYPLASMPHLRDPFLIRPSQLSHMLVTPDHIMQVNVRGLELLAQW